MSAQIRGRVVARELVGGGGGGHTSLYRIQVDGVGVLECDYIEIASDGFRTLAPGEEVWCSPSQEREGWATYVVPIRPMTPRQLLGLPEKNDDEPDAISQLWF